MGICPADLARRTGRTLPGLLVRRRCSSWRSRLAAPGDPHGVQAGTQRAREWGGWNADRACTFDGVSPAAVSRKAPQTAQGRMLYGVRVLPRWRTVERPPGLHTPASRRARSARERLHLRRGMAGVGWARSRRDRTDRLRPAHRRPDRAAGCKDRAAGRGRRAAAGDGYVGVDLRTAAGRSGQPPSYTDEPAEPGRTEPSSGCRQVGTGLHPQHRHLSPGVSSTDRPGDRRLRRPRHCVRLRSGP
jgi:hypothetical protein